MYNKFKPFFIGELGGFAVSALAIALVALVEITESGMSIFGYVVGALAWLGAIVGFVCYLITTSVSRIHRRRMNSQNKPKKSCRIQKLPGIISITVKPLNLLVCIVFVVGLAVCIIDLLFPYITHGMTVIVAVTYYSFVLHSVIDGKNYKIYKFYKGR